MNSSSLSLFFTLLLCASNLAFFDANSIQTFSRFPSSDNRTETDRLSLLALKSQLYDPLKTLASWNSSLDHCIWPGVSCGRRHRRVTKLDLSSLSLNTVLGSPISTEGDIYSFGIVLLELMIRKRPTDAMFDDGLSLHELAEMALLDQDHLTDIVEATLIEAKIGPTNLSYGAARCVEVEYHKRMACIASILHIGVACSMKSPNDRINMDEAVRRLKLVKDVQLGAGAVSDLQVL
ncbi:hypothetical protein Droror1_Dr00010895 [Drosera rotundifolia]